jgi:hypothetical protein
VLISISLCTLSSVIFTISLLTDINTEVLGIVNGKIVKVTDKNIQKEIDINTEVIGIVNSEIVKVTDENVQKEIDINTEELGIVNSEIVKVTGYLFLSVHCHLLILLFHH